MNMNHDIKFNRVWAMPNADTFEIKPIKSFVMSYINKSKISVDPFARNFTIPTYTNDLNENTKAMYHLDSLDFLKKIEDDGITPDLVIFDPPYSIRQMKEVYSSIGLNFNQSNSQRCARWFEEKNIINRILPLNGIVLHFGWNTTGMGIKRGFKIEEILLVSHGGAHNDTICMAEKKYISKINTLDNFE